MKQICVDCGDLKDEGVFSKTTPNKCRDCFTGSCYYTYKGLIECPNCHILRDRLEFKKLYQNRPEKGMFCNYCNAKGFERLPDNHDGATRKCNGCLDIKPVTEFIVYIDNRDKKLRYRSYCKDCDRKHCKVQYKDYLYCKDCKTIKARTEFTPATRKSKYSSQCTECSRIYAKKLRDNAPPEKKRESWKKYKATHEEYEKKRLKTWMNENKDQFSAISQRYRIKLKQLEDTLTGEEWANTRSYFQDTCAVCDSQDRIELDHWIPISWGQIGNVKENVVPLCKFHNMSKKNRNPNKWITIADNIVFEKTTKLYEYLAEINELSVEEYKEFIDLCFEDRDTTKKKTQKLEI